MYCFAAYVAVQSRDPVTRDLLAYSRLIIREALRRGGNGWQEYDWFFRRQAAIDSGTAPLKRPCAVKGSDMGLPP